MKRVICVGHAAIDRVYRIDELPTKATKVRAIEHLEAGGGMAANAAATIARLGGQVELWSRRETPGVEGIEVGEMSNRLRVTPGHWLQLSGDEPGGGVDRRGRGRTFTTGGGDALWLKVEAIGE